MALHDAVMLSLGEHDARNVRGERSRARLTQEQLGERMGWPKHAVYDLEAGRRPVRVDDLPALCRALGVGLAELLRDADPGDVEALRLG